MQLMYNQYKGGDVDITCLIITHTSISHKFVQPSTCQEKNELRILEVGQL